LRALPICRISANRGKAVSPHFAGSYEKNAVTLAEFLTTPSEGAITVDDEKLKRDLETAVINLFFAHEGISTVFVPLSLAPWEMPDAEVALLPDGLAFRKRPRWRNLVDVLQLTSFFIDLPGGGRDTWK
jgi:hypothetical protein